MDATLGVFIATVLCNLYEHTTNNFQDEGKGC